MNRAPVLWLVLAWFGAAWLGNAANAADLGDAVVFPDLNRATWLNASELSGAGAGGGGTGSLDLEILTGWNGFGFRGSYGRSFSGFGFGLGLRKESEGFSLLGGIGAGFTGVGIGVSPVYSTTTGGIAVGASARVALGKSARIAATTASVQSPAARWAFGIGFGDAKWSLEGDLQFRQLETLEPRAELLFVPAKEFTLLLAYDCMVMPTLQFGGLSSIELGLTYRFWKSGGPYVLVNSPDDRLEAGLKFEY